MGLEKFGDLLLLTGDQGNQSIIGIDDEASPVDND